MSNLRVHRRYVVVVQLQGRDLLCYVGYQMQTQGYYATALRVPDDYPMVIVALEAQPGAVGREASVEAMRQIAPREGWESFNLDDPAGWAGVRRVRSLTALLPEEDHVAAVKTFFVESIQQLREELTEFKKRRPDLPWTGG